MLSWWETQLGKFQGNLSPSSGHVWEFTHIFNVIFCSRQLGVDGVLFL